MVHVHHQNVRIAQSDHDLRSFQCLARQYISWLGEDLSYQQVEEELAQLACYNPPFGCILLASSQNNDTPEHNTSSTDAVHGDSHNIAALDVGIVGIRRLSSTTSICRCNHQRMDGKDLDMKTTCSKSGLDRNNSAATFHTEQTSEGAPPCSSDTVEQTAGQQGCHVCLPCCEMKRLYVVPGHQCKGVGRTLVKAAVKQAYSMGYRYMVLDTLERLAAANKIYASEGFERIPAYYASLEDAIFLGKRLYETS